MANLIHVNAGTRVQFLDSGGTEDLTLASLGADAGRVSTQYDLGDPRPNRIRWNAEFQFATTPVIGEVVSLYAAGSPDDATTKEDGDVGTADAALTGGEDKLRNLQYIGQVQVDEASASVKMRGSGTFIFDNRYLQIVVYNHTADALHATGANSWVDITMVPLEIQ